MLNELEAKFTWRLREKSLLPLAFKRWPAGYFICPSACKFCTVY